MFRITESVLSKYSMPVVLFCFLCSLLFSFILSRGLPIISHHLCLMQLHAHLWTGSLEVVCFLSAQLSLHVPSVNNELSFCSISFHQPFYSIFLFVLLPLCFPWSFFVLPSLLHVMHKQVSNVKLGSALSSHQLCRRCAKVIFNCESGEWKKRAVCFCVFVARQDLSCQSLFSQAKDKSTRNSQKCRLEPSLESCVRCVHTEWKLFQNTHSFHLRSSLSLHTRECLRNLQLKLNFHLKSRVWLWNWACIVTLTTPWWALDPCEPHHLVLLFRFPLLSFLLLVFSSHLSSLGLPFLHCADACFDVCVAKTVISFLCRLYLVACVNKSLGVCVSMDRWRVACSELTAS